jgi:hypothetical protein
MGNGMKSGMFLARSGVMMAVLIYAVHGVAHTPILARLSTGEISQ